MERVRNTGTEDEKKMKTRCYYTDYVNHMIRFYLSTPDTLKMEGKRKADIENWLAVQDVWRKLGADNKLILEMVYDLHFKVTEGVRIYCEKTGTKPHDVWVLVTKTCAAIARRRGLI